MTYSIKIKSKEKFRTFPKDYYVELNYDNNKTIFVMGKNGCGKSTLIQAIRGAMNSNDDALTKWHAKSDCEEILTHFDVEIEGFKNIYHLDPDGQDNAFSMYNAASADDFVELGGFAMRRLSSGEKSLVMLTQLKKTIIDDDNTLIVIDELDNHLDYGLRPRFSKWLDSIFPKSKKLIITHDLLVACLGEGDVVSLDSYRTTPEEGYAQFLSGTKPFTWENKAKEVLFAIYTNCTLKNIKENITEENNHKYNIEQDESKS